MSDVVVMNSSTPVQVVSTDTSAPGPEGPPGPPGDITGYATRAALAGVAAVAGTTAYLKEAGRDGAFVFSTANLSAEVTLDPLQGIYVPPTAAPTGASGAWVRKFDGPVHVDWFGAVGDNVANDGSIFIAALDYLDRGRVEYQGAQTLRCGAKNYYLGTSQLNIRTTLVFEGAARRATQLRWAANSKGIVVQRLNTADGTTVGGEYGGAGDDCIIRQMTLKGSWAGSGSDVEGEYHGIELRARATVMDVEVRDWQGDGIFSRCIAGSAGANEGNSNVAQLHRVVIHHCRNGMYVDGPDANIWTVVGCDFRENRRWGAWDSSFLGNTYLGMHTASNGHDGVFGVAGVPHTKATYGGNTYSVRRDQGAGAQTNAPTGTATNNTWWIYNPMGGYAEPWVNTQTYRDGGAFRSDDANAVNCWVGCYTEGGQNPPTLVGRDLVIGGLHSETRIITEAGGDNGATFGGWLQGTNIALKASGQLEVGNTLNGKGRENWIGSEETAGFTSHLTIRAGGNATLNFSINSLGSPGYITSGWGDGLTLNSYGSRTRIRFNDATIADFTTNGMNLASGKVVQVDGTQVVGARKTGWATATGSATRTTFDTTTVTLPQLAERVKALIDDLHGTAGHGIIGT